MVMGLFALALLLLSSLVAADIPAQCLHSDIPGEWHIKLVTDEIEDCSSINFDDYPHYSVNLTFSEPNEVMYEGQHAGTWTMVYNQGFDFRMEYERRSTHFFTFSKYETHPKDRTVTSYCGETTPTKYCEEGVCGCYIATKNTPVEPRVDPIDPPGPKMATAAARLSQIKEGAKWAVSDVPTAPLNAIKNSFIRNTPKAVANTDAAEYVSLPKSFDWRNVSGVDYVQLSPLNQHPCGSCYIFASTGALEARTRIHGGFEHDDMYVSRQQLVDCSPYSQGCDGGFPFLMGKYFKDFSVVDQSSYPYAHHEQTCKKISNPIFTRTLSEYSYVGGYYGACSEEKMRMELVKNGPMPVSFEVLDDFLHYEGGIYHHIPAPGAPSFELTNHAVTVVGYGEENGEKYWTVANSWGYDWGEDGFFRIRRGTDECAIESMAVSFTI